MQAPSSTHRKPLSPLLPHQISLFDTITTPMSFQSFVGNTPTLQQSFDGNTVATPVSHQTFVGDLWGNTPTLQQSFVGNTVATPAQYFMGSLRGNTPAL
ncbi:hypothetical protein PILCRDRAFT_13525 [Piloderma croceum F 1598]|uniref:Uncharacterized protein n=1 Tax=Piloderma croceum (strain F 1598) TaxID=765440 RepID=A0A0C3ES93_PILCF|nr:hypothetical protein PILCRDRAFT_13525 [Piloderma croceum F 1598]